MLDAALDCQGETANDTAAISDRTFITEAPESISSPPKWRGGINSGGGPLLKVSVGSFVVAGLIVAVRVLEKGRYVIGGSSRGAKVSGGHALRERSSQPRLLLPLDGNEETRTLGPPVANGPSSWMDSQSSGSSRQPPDGAVKTRRGPFLLSRQNSTASKASNHVRVTNPDAADSSPSISVDITVAKSGGKVKTLRKSRPLRSLSFHFPPILAVR